jgi:hypothetical protein
MRQSWVKLALASLERGERVDVRPLGGSMRGRIESGQRVTLAPARAADVRVGDAVFVRWRGGYLLHLVKRREGSRLLIGNNLGRVNGWVEGDAVLGRVVEVHP